MVSDPGSPLNTQGVVFNVQCVVTDQSGTEYTQRGLVGVVGTTTGLLPLCLGEELARDATYGWLEALNTLLTTNTNLPATGTAGDLLEWDGAAWQLKNPAEFSTNARGALSKDAGSTTTIGVVDTFVKITGATTTNNLTLFDDDSGTDNRLRYTGTVTRKFRVTAKAHLSGTTSKVVRLRLGKGGTTIAATEDLDFGDSTDGRASVMAQGIVELATNEYVEVFVANGTDGVSFTVLSMTVVVDPA
ncbi:MAG: hypothetical protein ACYTBJ_25935 [Planctomycetota bacterium]|jgi:hypothetical protein